LAYARSLKFEEQPDYDYCRSLMNKGTFFDINLVLVKIDEIDDGIFDWMIILDQKRKQKETLREADRTARAQEKGTVQHCDAEALASPLNQYSVSQARPSVATNKNHQIQRRPSANPELRVEISHSNADSPTVPTVPTVLKAVNEEHQPKPSDPQPDESKPKKKKFSLFSCFYSCLSSKE
jgi:hypothetical protein